METKRVITFIFLLFLGMIIGTASPAWAMPVGTLLYRSSGDGLAYGHNTNKLIVSEHGLIKNIYSGHAGIYVGQENGVDYVVEMEPQGAIKIPAKQFINTAAGEKLIGAKIPRDASLGQRMRAAMLAKSLARAGMAYDFSFKNQKGPASGDWTCVGLTEKVFESSNSSNPNDLRTLVYDVNDYAVDITPDGFDNYSVYNEAGDCFSIDAEFSKIARKNKITVPAPELLGYDMGLELDGDRYLFIPQTQYAQNSLIDVPVDIELSSSFPAADVRGEVAVLPLALKWSLINNPVSTIKQLGAKTKEWVTIAKEKLFPDKQAIVLDNQQSESYEAAVSDKQGEKSLTLGQSKQQTTVLSSNNVNTGVSNNDTTKVNAVVTKNSQASSVSASLGENKTVKVSVGAAGRTTTAALKINNNTSLELSTSKNKGEVNNVQEVVAATKSNSAPVINTVTPKTSVTSRLKKPAPSKSEPIVNNTDKAGTTTPEANNVKAPPKALIAKLYSNGDNDWIEIVNASSDNLDLAAHGYRLEKSKTGSDPTLIMRFGNEADGVYPGGTVLAPGGSYLVVRSSAANDLKSLADAIATKDTFSWSEDGYTLYLGTASISSDDDVDIVDKLGYGTAKYYESAPAPKIELGYALERKATAQSTIASLSSGGLEELWPRLFDSQDNSQDFLLIPYDYDLIASQSDANNESQNKPSTVSDDEGLFTNPDTLSSEGLMQLWHFDECYGNTMANELQFTDSLPMDLKGGDSWAVGRWGCALKLIKSASSTKAELPPEFKANELTVNFFYRALEASNFSIMMRFINKAPNTKQFALELREHATTVTGFPGPNKVFEDVKWPADDKWHQISLVLSEEKGYWGLYLDGKEQYRYDYIGVIPGFTSWHIESLQETPVAFEELAMWQRALAASELKEINSWNLPFAPYTWPDPQVAPQLQHHWDFNENNGLIAKDSVGSNNLKINLTDWTYEGRDGSALNVSRDFFWDLTEVPAKDLSLSFWWRNISYPDEGRLRLNLSGNGKDIMTLVPTIYNPSISFNGWSSFIVDYGQNLFPQDKKWHHLALTYDSYRYRLRFFLDGEMKKEVPLVKFPEEAVIDRLKIISENFPSAIDELKIWSGVLNKEAVKQDYNIYK